MAVSGREFLVGVSYTNLALRQEAMASFFYTVPNSLITVITWDRTYIHRLDMGQSRSAFVRYLDCVGRFYRDESDDHGAPPQVHLGLPHLRLSRPGMSTVSLVIPSHSVSWLEVVTLAVGEASFEMFWRLVDLGTFRG